MYEIAAKLQLIGSLWNVTIIFVEIKNDEKRYYINQTESW